MKAKIRVHSISYTADVTIATSFRTVRMEVDSRETIHRMHFAPDDARKVADLLNEAADRMEGKNQ